jgi:CBS domain-containing protein
MLAPSDTFMLTVPTRFGPKLGGRMLEVSSLRRQQPGHAPEEDVRRPRSLRPLGAQPLRAPHEGERAESLERGPERPIREIMSTEVVAFTAQTSIQEATRIMLDRQISGAPVVDEARRPIGIVSKTDLLEAWYEHHKSQDDAASSEVGHIMVPYLLAAQHTAPIALAAALMAYEGVHRLLVLDEQSAMIGIVTSLDILRWLGNCSGFFMNKPGPV